MTTYYLLPTTDHLLLATYYLLLTTYYLLLTTYYLLPTTSTYYLIGERSLDTPLWEKEVLRTLEEETPALAYCIRSALNLPQA